MSDIEARCALGPVQLRAHDGAQIADGDLHRVGRGPFRLTADVVGGPGEYYCGGGVDASSRENGPDVRHSGLFTRKKNDVADDGEAGASHDKRRPDFRFLGRDGHDHGQTCGQRIRRYRQQLSLARREAEFFDDGGEKK